MEGSLTATPRPISAVRAASMSSTTRYTLRAEPGAAGVRSVPNWMEQSEPGGVNWSKRTRQW